MTGYLRPEQYGKQLEPVDTGSTQHPDEHCPQAPLERCPKTRAPGGTEHWDHTACATQKSMEMQVALCATAAWHALFSQWLLTSENESWKEISMQTTLLRELLRHISDSPSTGPAMP